MQLFWSRWRKKRTLLDCHRRRCCAYARPLKQLSRMVHALFHGVSHEYAATEKMTGPARYVTLYFIKYRVKTRSQRKDDRACNVSHTQHRRAAVRPGVRHELVPRQAEPITVTFGSYRRSRLRLLVLGRVIPLFPHLRCHSLQPRRQHACFDC